MRKVVEDVDWSGTADVPVSEWNAPFDEFVMKPSDGRIVIPMARVLSNALNRYIYSTTASSSTKCPRLDEDATKRARRRLQSFVRKFEIRLDPADIRALVIQACLTEYEGNLPSPNTSASGSHSSTDAALPTADLWGFDSISESSTPPPSPPCLDSLPGTNTSPVPTSPLTLLSERARGKLPQRGNRQPQDSARVGLGLGVPTFDDSSRLEPSTGDIGDI